MEFLSQTYVALRGPTGAPQTAKDTIARLSDRLSPATLLGDRRAAVQALKGLARDHPDDVAARALPGLINVLADDAEIDPDIAKAVLEALASLSAHDTRIADAVLADERTVPALFALLGGADGGARLPSMHLLSVLLDARRGNVQTRFLSACNAAASVMAALDDRREVVRTEAITLVRALSAGSADIQKVLAFEGAFEKLFAVVAREGGVDGGPVAEEALVCLDGLLRFNSSNQAFFRETDLPPQLCALLAFPPHLALHEAAPQEFALQFWDPQKTANADRVVALMGMLIHNNSTSPQELTFARCLLELSLASNAPTTLKTHALRLLPARLAIPLPQLALTPYVPVPGTNGEEWDRLEPASALDALVEMVLAGEYGGVDGDAGPGSSARRKDKLELRAAAAGVFENFVSTEDVKTAIVQAMLPPEGAPSPPPITPLLHSLVNPPDASAPDAGTQFACVLFAHLVRSAPAAKAAARSIKPDLPSSAGGGSGAFFVPADSPGAPPPPPPDADDDDEPPQALIPMLCENLSLALLARGRQAEQGDGDAVSHTISVLRSRNARRDLDALIAAYVALLSQWLWDDPSAVREFADSGGVGILVEPINQAMDADAIVPGLCAMLLGICYEFDREAGEITRATIRPILDRLGVDNLVGRMARLREDPRLAGAAPDAVVVPRPRSDGTDNYGRKPEEVSSTDEGELWFDWAFVEFWKANYYTIQRSFSVDPDQASSASEGAALIAGLRRQLEDQAREIARLQAEVGQAPARGGVSQQNSRELEARLREEIKAETENLMRVELAAETRSLRAELDAAREEAAALRAEAAVSSGAGAGAGAELEQVRGALAVETQKRQVAEGELSAARESLANVQSELAALRKQLAAEVEKREAVEKEQEDLLVLLDEVSSKRRRDKALMKEALLEVSEDEEDEDDDEEDE
ncbi:p115 like vesicle tethering protein [Schizophyllum commune]